MMIVVDSVNRTLVGIAALVLVLFGSQRVPADDADTVGITLVWKYDTGG